jgi:hypothetical protein
MTELIFQLDLPRAELDQALINPTRQSELQDPEVGRVLNCRSGFGSVALRVAKNHPRTGDRAYWKIGELGLRIQLTNENWPIHSASANKNYFTEFD